MVVSIRNIPRVLLCVAEPQTLSLGFCTPRLGCPTHGMQPLFRICGTQSLTLQSSTLFRVCRVKGSSLRSLRYCDPGAHSLSWT